MGIDQKVRSLHCRFQAGLKFQELDGEDVIFLKDVPYELEDIIARWIIALPPESTTKGIPSCILREHEKKGLALTEEGWGNYVTWMVDTLIKAQAQEGGVLN